MRIHKSSCIQLLQGLGKQTPLLAPEKDCKAQAHPSSYIAFYGLTALKRPRVCNHLSAESKLCAVVDSRDQRSAASVRSRE